MKFSDARSHVIPFGKHEGVSVDDIAVTDSGLLYLDWLRGELTQSRTRPETLQVLETYLEDGTIKRDLNVLLEDE